MDITTIVTCKEIENVRFQHWNWLLDLNDEKEGNVISRIAPVFFFLYKILAPFLPLYQFKWKYFVWSKYIPLIDQYSQDDNKIVYAIQLTCVCASIIIIINS